MEEHHEEHPDNKNREAEEDSLLINDSREP